MRGSVTTLKTKKLASLSMLHSKLVACISNSSEVIPYLYRLLSKHLEFQSKYLKILTIFPEIQGDGKVSPQTYYAYNIRFMDHSIYKYSFLPCCGVSFFLCKDSMHRDYINNAVVETECF
jgi:hypothetical protein